MSSDNPLCGRRGVWLAAGLGLVATMAFMGSTTTAAAQSAMMYGSAYGSAYSPMYYGPSTGGPMAGRPAGLQSLVSQLSDQFWFAYRANLPLHRYCHDQLRQAIEAWNKSPQSAADRELMVTWLQDSMGASMPGARKPLPPLPDFGGAAAPAESVTKATAPSTTSNSPSVADAPAESMDRPADAEQDSWFGQPAEAEPSLSSPIDSNSSGSNPFGDDPLGL